MTKRDPGTTRHRSYRPRSRRSKSVGRTACLSLSLCIFLVSLGAAASASADEPGGQSSALPSAQSVTKAIESESSRSITPRITDPSAAEGVAHQELDRNEALELMRGVFGSELQSAAGPFDELHVEKFLSNNVAVIPANIPSESSNVEAGKESSSGNLESSSNGEHEGSALLDSTLPLRTEAPSGREEAVNLGLKASEGELQPTNPLVEVGIPKELGEGIELPEAGVKIELEGAPQERSPSTVDKSVAFYPNVAKDTDLAVAPTPTGVETLTQLQSAESPTSETFKLRLPAEAELMEEEGGGAKVVNNGNTLLEVLPPAALDANGKEVPVGIDVSGDSITLNVAPEKSDSYPILLDPLIQTYEWQAKSTKGGLNSTYGTEQWYPEQNTQAYKLSPEVTVAESGLPPVGTPGLFIHSGEPGTVAAGNQANWVYTVPRYFADLAKYSQFPTSFIKGMKLSDLIYTDPGIGPPINPYLWAGIWDYHIENWESILSRNGHEGALTNSSYVYEFPNPQPDENAKVAAVLLHSTEANANTARSVYVGNATMELGDTGAPTGSIWAPTKWVNNTAEPFGYELTDTGLGVYSLQITGDSLMTSVPSNWKTPTGCTGVGGNACPHSSKSSESGSPAIAYEPSAMPTGHNEVTVQASDPVGNTAAAVVGINVDHTAPELSLSGSMTEQSTLGTKQPTYTLKYSATDGTEAPPSAGVPFGSSGTGEGQLGGPYGVAADDNGHVWVADDENDRIEEYSENGEYIRQFGSKGSGNGQFNYPTNIAVAPNGNLCVSDSGNFRIQCFNSKGEYLRQFGSEGTENGKFVEPYGIAIGPNGNIWVADPRYNRVEEFNESGQFLLSVAAKGYLGNGATEFSYPRGVAVDAKGNVWVADEGHNCIQELSSSGGLITKFGATGSGTGQMSEPLAVAIDSAGNLLVDEWGNGRIQEFRPNGEVIKEIGSEGSGNEQFYAPRGIAAGAGNTAFITDASWDRVDKWHNIEPAPQSGVASTEVKLDGKAVEPPYSPGCSTKDCAISKEWSLESSQYTGGKHTVEVTATDAVGLKTTKTLPIELAPDHTRPSLLLSGSMTEQSTLGDTRPRYSLKLTASDGTEEEGPSTVVSTFSANGTAGGQVKHPAGTTVDSKGNLWVADKTNNRIEEFNERSEFLEAFGKEVNKTKVEAKGTEAEQNLCTATSGNICQAGKAGSANGQLSAPVGVAIDSKGNLWIADKGNDRIEEFNEKGEYVSKFGSVGTGNGQFASGGPEGLAIDSHNNIWVSDTYAGRVQEFNEKGEFTRVVGSRGSGMGQLGEPTGIAIGPGGNVWIADWQNNRVAEFNEKGEYLRQFGTEGTGNGQFERPDAISVDSRDEVWVGDEGNGRVQEFNEKGEYFNQFGSKGSGTGQFTFSYPFGIATDTKGDIWVTDANNNRIEKWHIPNYVATYTSSFGSSGTGNGQFSHPADIAVDAKGNLWVTDRSNRRIEEFNEKGEYQRQFGSYGSEKGQLKNPSSLAINSEGEIVIADTSNNRIEVFSKTGEFLRTYGKEVNKTKVEEFKESGNPHGITESEENLCTGASGNVCQAGKAGSGSGQFYEPEGIAVDSHGNIWVADTVNNRLQEFNELGGFIKTVGSSGSGAGQFSSPRDLTVGPGNNVWVTDWTNNRVEEFSEAGEYIRQLGSTGTGLGQFTHPDGIIMNSNGEVLVADTSNERVEEFTQSGEYVAQFGSSGSGAGQLSLSQPVGLATNAKGDIWVTDSSNNRVERWNRYEPAVQTGIASTEITLDGSKVASTEVGCRSENCSIAPEWTVESGAIAIGQHTVVAKVTDGAGNVTSKTLSIEVQRDQTAPSVELGGNLVEAPSGWVEDKTYGFNAQANDSGFGATSIEFRIDGEGVSSETAPCPNGGCILSLATSVDMAKYKAGNNTAEVIATDGAGNATTKRWTIKVDPSGNVSSTEAARTLEAIDPQAVEPTPSGEIDGQQVDPTLKEAGSDGLEIAGAEAAGTVSNEVENGFTLEGEEEGKPVEEPEAPTTIVPTTVSTAATEPMDLSGGSAAVYANAREGADLAVRPQPYGLETLMVIREPSAPKTYGWEVSTPGGATLQPTEEGGAQVVTNEPIVDAESGETVAAGQVTAVMASPQAVDAAGNVVPTKVELVSNVAKVSVEPSSQTVYPIILSPPWTSTEAAMSSPTEVGGEEEAYMSSAPPPDNNACHLKVKRADNGGEHYTIYGAAENICLPGVGITYQDLNACLEVHVHVKGGGERWEAADCRNHHADHALQQELFPRAECHGTDAWRTQGTGTAVLKGVLYGTGAKYSEPRLLQCKF